MGKKLTQQEFEDKVRVHFSKEELEILGEYTNQDNNILCWYKYGEVKPIAYNLIIGQKPSILSAVNKTEYIINQFKEVHGDKYDYSLVNYKSSKKKVKIICPFHGLFKQKPNHHLGGIGCKKCGYEKVIVKNTFTNEEFIQKAKEIHGDKYIYDATNYVKARKKVKIICPTHGEFVQIAHDHLYGCGCKECINSKGEEKISNSLKELNVTFHREHKFDGCSNIRKLPFDFYLPDHNILIEFDGKQHSKPVKFFGGKDGFKKRKKLDKIRDNFAKENNYNLIRINQSQFDDIPVIINKILNG